MYFLEEQWRILKQAQAGPFPICIHHCAPLATKPTLSIQWRVPLPHNFHTLCNVIWRTSVIELCGSCTHQVTSCVIYYIVIMNISMYPIIKVLNKVLGSCPAGRWQFHSSQCFWDYINFITPMSQETVWSQETSVMDQLMRANLVYWSTSWM